MKDLEERVVSVGIGLPPRLINWLDKQCMVSSQYRGQSRASIIRHLLEKEIRNGARRKGSRA